MQLEKGEAIMEVNFVSSHVDGWLVKAPRVILGMVILYFVYSIIIYPHFFHPLRKVAGPRSYDPIFGSSWIGFERPRAKSFIRWINEVKTPQGLMSVRGLLNTYNLVPTSEETLRYILSSHSREFVKPDYFIAILTSTLGYGILSSGGEDHKSQRKALIPFFQPQEVERWFETYYEKAMNLVGVIQQSSNKQNASQDQSQGNVEESEYVVDFNDLGSRLTLDVIWQTVMSQDLKALSDPGNETVKLLTSSLRGDPPQLVWAMLKQYLGGWLCSFSPGSIGRSMENAKSHLRKYTDSVIGGRRDGRGKQKADDDKRDLLHRLLHDSNASDDDDEIARHILNVVGAGFETTSSTLAALMFSLAHRPEIQQKIRQEVRASLPDLLREFPGDKIVTKLKELTWLNAVISETLRFHAPVPLLMRTNINQIVIEDVDIPAGTLFFILPAAINLSEEFWGPKATEFDASRWINEDGTQNTSGGCRKSIGSLSFLQGPHGCLGQEFARNELRTVVAIIVMMFEFSPFYPDREYEPTGFVSSKPVGGLWLRMKKVYG